MTREEAIELARNYWASHSRPDWHLQEEFARYVDASPATGPEIYGVAEPHWRIPLHWSVPHLGASHALAVFVNSLSVREISWGE